MAAVDKQEKENGTIRATRERLTEAKAPESYKLNDLEKKTLKSKESKINTLKLVLANAQTEVWAAEQRRNAVQAELVNANTEFTNTIGEWAKERGIDPTNPNHGRWNFNTETFQFTRLN